MKLRGQAMKKPRRDEHERGVFNIEYFHCGRVINMSQEEENHEV